MHYGSSSLTVNFKYVASSALYPRPRCWVRNDFLPVSVLKNRHMVSNEVRIIWNFQRNTFWVSVLNYTYFGIIYDLKLSSCSLLIEVLVQQSSKRLKPYLLIFRSCWPGIGYSSFGSFTHWNWWHLTLTDTGENVQKWTRVFSTRRWVILVARTRRKKREEYSVSTFGRFPLWTSFESSPVSVNT